MQKIKYIASLVLSDRQKYIYGFANLVNLLPPELEKFNSALSIGQRLPDQVIDQLIDGPTPAYYDAYQQLNEQLTDLLQIICLQLTEAGIPHHSIGPTLTDRQLDADAHYKHTLRCQVSHKMAATRAGLGWIGKTALFISKCFGPRLRLSTILLTNHVDSTRAIQKSCCGKCNLCVDSCPAKAANGMLWHDQIDRDRFYDAFKCRAMCRKLSREKLGKKISLCGICINVCPWGHRP
ncbi:MAG: epoxyqueuosine reductase [Desulfobacteraceae bacterium]|nr:epoxyqueuosine reductase [Desulfobacteraceae bacterium]